MRNDCIGFSITKDNGKEHTLSAQSNTLNSHRFHQQKKGDSYAPIEYVQFLMRALHKHMSRDITSCEFGKDATKRDLFAIESTKIDISKKDIQQDNRSGCCRS